MYCKNCGNEIDPYAAICVKCGYAKNTGKNFCANCGQPVAPGAAACTNCGFANFIQPIVDPSQQKSRLVAGLLGIFLGGLGVHNFYLGYYGKAIAQIILSFCCAIGVIWGLVEGIMLIAGAIPTDANGVPLKE